MSCIAESAITVREILRGSHAVAKLPASYGDDDCYPKAPCTQIGNTWALKYFVFRDFRARVHHTEVHGPLGLLNAEVRSGPRTL